MERFAKLISIYFAWFYSGPGPRAGLMAVVRPPTADFGPVPGEDCARYRGGASAGSESAPSQVHPSGGWVCQRACGDATGNSARVSGFGAGVFHVLTEAVEKAHVRVVGVGLTRYGTAREKR